MRLDPGRVIAGRYVVMEKIGVGGMAVVYRAKDRKLDRSVTLKVMREEYLTDPEFAARFQVEARAAASLSNPNIVNVYDSGQDESVHYIVMEYIDGLTLKELIQKKAPFKNEEILGVGMQIAAALAHAHQNGVIHRDIKPQNIMLTKQGIVKVMDFGIARAASGNTMTTTGNTMGSVHYFSPEQARGVYVDKKSDIYSLGIVLFEMSTGRLPFQGDTAVTVALKQIDEPLPDIRALNPNILPALESIIEKAACKNTAQRYQSTEELMVDLKQAINQQSGNYTGMTGVTDSPTIQITPEEIAAIQKEHKYWEEPFWEEPQSIKARKKKMDAGEFEEDVDEKTLEHKIIIAGIITSLAIILLISSLAWFFYQRGKPKPIPAPNLIGMTLDDAKSLAEESGSFVIQDELQWNDEVEANVIFAQDIPEGGMIQPGVALHVTVSQGSNKIVVPDVHDTDEKDLADIFLQAQLAFTTEYEYSDNVAQDIVIRQFPSAGSKVDPETSITVYVSRGPVPRTISVPNVVGKTEAEAITMLQDAELVIGPASKASSVTIKKGLIMGQTLTPGTQVNKGAEISYVISTGLPETKPTPVPSAEPPKQIEKQLIIEAPTLDEAVDSVHLRVLKIVEGRGELIIDKEIPMDDFPYVLSIQGRGIVDYQVYLMDGEDGPGQLLMAQPVDFEMD